MAKVLVLELKAGRELDALVAEKVMGFVRRKVPRDYHGKHGGTDVLVPPDLVQDVDRGKYVYPPKGAIPLTWFTLHFSTDRAAARNVMDSHGYLYLYKADCDGPRVPKGWYECKLTRKDERKYYAIAPTMELAICMAALLAREIFEVELPQVA